MQSNMNKQDEQLRQEVYRDTIPPSSVFEDDGKTISRDPKYKRNNNVDNQVIGVGFPNEGGILVYRKGDKFPTKGWPFWEALVAIDVAKRCAFNFTRFLVLSPIRYIIPFFLLLPKKMRKATISYAIYAYSEMCVSIFKRLGVNMKTEYYCDVVREIKRVAALPEYNDHTAQMFIQVVCNVLEYDDAYRYRFQDLMAEVDRKEIVSRPGKELARILRIGASRGSGTRAKMNSFAKLFPYLFMLKEVKEPFVSFVSKLDFDKLMLDEIDNYRCLIWGGYDFGGVNINHRLSMRMMIDADWEKNKNKSIPNT